MLTLWGVVSCNPLGNIQVSNIVNPDSVPPTVQFLTMAPDTINGARNYDLQFEVNDNVGGSGIRTIELAYSPNGTSDFRVLRTLTAGGVHTVPFCPPNKNHPQPTFRVTATDKNKNVTVVNLGDQMGAAFTMALSEPPSVTVTSSEGTFTNADNTTLTVDACRLHACSNDAVMYEPFPSNNVWIYVGTGGGQPAAGDPGWLSCQDVLDNGHPLPDFSGDGDTTYNVWVKTEDTDIDGVTPIVSIGGTATNITITSDGTAPAASFNTAAAAMGSHQNFAVSLNLSDATAGLDTATTKIFYTPDSGNLGDFPFVEIGDLSGGTPEIVNFCVPNKTHPNGTFRIQAADLAGNTVSVDRSGFTITKTANPLLPTVLSRSLATPASNGSSNIRIDACRQTVCSAGSLRYETPDNDIYISVATAQPAAGDASWVSCADVLANGYTFNFPTQVGSGNYAAASLWVKSSGVDIDGTTPVNTISTSSVPLSIPYDYTPPALTGLDLGNLGNNRNLEILGTSILTGYSQGSFRLSPVCLDPSAIPAVQTYIAGTVSVSANNRTVTGTGTSFLTEFQPYDYTEINGIYTQILSIQSDTQLTLNEISGNTPGLVGSGLQASKAMAAYGGIKVTKGAGAPPAATGTDWQPCDSVNLSITYGNLVNGVNNLQFWIKDRGNNVATSFLPFAVTYNAPVITVVNGPTISTEVASMTINACGGGTRITHVLFNETGVRPGAADSGWQTCSTAIGALQSEPLAPGNHILKAYFKYNDNFVSENPVNVPVNYLPQVAWVETPLTIRPQTTYTLASCVGVDEIFINQGAAPAAAAAGWQPCTTATGGVSYELSATGSQTVNVWYKTAGTVSPDFSQVTVNFVPPEAFIFGSNIVSTTQPPLSVNTCEGISRVLVRVDDAAPATPAALDFMGPGSMACTTALNGIIPPAVVGEGLHTYDVWFQFNDNYVLPHPFYSRVTVTYAAPDTTPPRITGPGGATNPVSLTLDNGDGDGLVPGVTENIENFASRAIFTLNTCQPMSPVALTGTVSITAGTRFVTGAGTSFISEIAAGDFIRIGTLSLKVKQVDSDTALELVLTHGTGAASVAAQKVYPEDTIAGMMLTTTNTPPAANNAFWLACGAGPGAFRSASLPDGTHTLYAWFKDVAGNVTTDVISKTVVINTTPDTTPPDRPPVIVEGAPTITTAPARLTITTCDSISQGLFNDIDQIYVEPSRYPAAPVMPDAGLPAWQNCTTATGAITYHVDLAGSYTLSVWFKDAAGNINPEPRDVSFIFAPSIGNLPQSVAYWTMDNTHRMNNRIIDAKGNNHLNIWDPTNVTSVTGRQREALQFSGTNSYVFAENTATLKPAVSVTLSLWARLTQGDAGTKGLAGNGSYGLKLQGGNVVFYASGEANAVTHPTASLTTGWHHLIGTSDGRYVKLYIDGQQVGGTLDLGTPANLVYGSSQLFVVGGVPSGASVNPSTSNLFNDRLDEVVVWNQFFTDQQALDHYIDAFNNYKVRQVSTPAPTIASASFYGEFMQNALLTIPSCAGIKFIYTDPTTHPPLVNTPRWQLCTTVPGGIHHANLPQGGHELKIWTKDEYDNISASYLKLNTTITGIAYQAPATLYYTFDNNQLNLGSVFDIFSGHTALNVGASANQVGIQNEGFNFVRAESDFVERKYAFNAQPKTALTLSVWANLVVNNNIQQVIAGTRQAGHGYNIEIDQAANEVRFKVETADGTRHVGIPTSAYVSGFHNLIGTYDGRHMRLYLDGNEAAHIDYTTNRPVVYTCLGAFTIGSGATCNQGGVAGSYFNGVIDEVILWDSVLTAGTIYDFFNGQDTVPPEPVDMTPKNNEFTIGIPIARFNADSCDDISAVYVTINDLVPPADVAGWQACSTTGDLIRSPLLESGVNNVKFWFKDAAGNVSLTSSSLNMTFNFDFTIPRPNSYWTLDRANVDAEVAYDVSNGKNGIITGALEEAGKVDEARVFNGTSDYIEVPYDASFQPSLDVTLSVWFRPDSFAVGAKFLAGNLNTGGYALVLNGNSLEFRVTVDGSVETISQSMIGAPVGEWYHAVGVYENGTLRLFLNGAETLPSVTATPLNKNITYANANSLVIGAAATATTGAAGNYFPGRLDEVAFWDAALSDTVVAEIYDRGLEGDKVWYNVNPPEIPVSLNITYYNSLVSRANLTVNSCAGLDYIIVTKDEFPPDKNDEDWQRCNTLVGGLLSKELRTTDSFGKLWTKDNFGNVSRNFEYVPITTKYDKPIARPVVHWTFDNSHYVAGTRTAFDRLSQINLRAETLKNHAAYNGTTNCSFSQVRDPDTSVLQTNQAGVLSQSFNFPMVSNGVAPFVASVRPAILRANHPENAKTKPASKLSVSAWVFYSNPAVESSYNRHIVSNFFNNKGWALWHGPRDGGATNADNRSYIFTVATNNGTFRSYFEDKNLTVGWHLITGTFDGNEVALFIDGIFVKSFATPPNSQIVYEAGVNTFVGSQASTGQLPDRFSVASQGASCMSGVLTYNPAHSHYLGRIDEILIWDKALSKLEVSSLYHNGADILYSTDLIPPANPSLTLENTRPDMFTNKAYFTLNFLPTNICYRNVLADAISGVLVNEGTRPDKQDARWEVCRDRLGSYGLEDLSDGGHTITVWFKDLAGNVTPASSDLVVNYINDLLPSANAVWPLDSTHNISKHQRDVIDDKVHDLQLVNFETPLNPAAQQVAGKVNEGVMLASTSATNGAFMSAASTKLLRPVNYFSVGGWFDLTSGDANTKVLVDHHSYASVTNRTGYKLHMSGGLLRFTVELDIAGTQNLTYPMASITTGWRNVVGIFTGWRLHLYVDGVQVASSPLLPERDYIRYDNPTDFRVGAESENNANPVSFLSAAVDELALWGYDMTPAQLTQVVNAGNSNTHIYTALPAPANVDNAFIYPYDAFGSRARMTILNCTNTPYIFVQEQNAALPSPVDADWRNCSTIPGAILSRKLPLGTRYVDVYAKNSDGVISSIAGRKEIYEIRYDYDLVLP